MTTGLKEPVVCFYEYNLKIHKNILHRLLLEPCTNSTGKAKGKISRIVKRNKKIKTMETVELRAFELGSFLPKLMNEGR
jgi:hypothetical protein